MSRPQEQDLPSNSKIASDGLNQAQREAIVDLLHYCMFADNFVALSENKFVRTVVGTLTWDKNISFESYEGGSIGKARKAKENAEYRDRLFKDVAKRLATKDARELALKLCRDLYQADAKMAALESQQLASIVWLLA